MSSGQLDVWQFIQSNPVLFTVISTWLVAFIGYVRSRFAGYETKLVQLAEKHGLELRQARAELREERSTWEQRDRENQAEIRQLIRQLAQVTSIPPEQFATPHRRSPRAKPSTEEEGNA